MKRILYAILGITSIVFVACEKGTDIVNVSDYDFISFQDDNVVFELNQDGLSTKTITVYSSKKLSSDVTYNLEVLPFEFNGDTGSTIPSEFYSVPVSVTIPANETSAQFEVTITDNGFGSSDRLVLGFADEDFAVNPHTISLPIVIVCPVNELILDITFDDYAEETSWELYSDISTSPILVASGGGYGDLDNETIQERICIENGDFGFVIYDAYGDGMCCNFGQGSYILTLNGEVIREGGSFAASEVTTFSL